MSNKETPNTLAITDKKVDVYHTVHEKFQVFWQGLELPFCDVDIADTSVDVIVEDHM